MHKACQIMSNAILHDKIKIKNPQLIKFARPLHEQIMPENFPYTSSGYRFSNYVDLIKDDNTDIFWYNVVKQPFREIPNNFLTS